MAGKTRLSLDGYGAKPAGSFAGKEASDEPPPVESGRARGGMVLTPGRLMNR